MSQHTAVRDSAREQLLRDALLDTVALLERRRAAEIDASYIDDYVALNWLEWNGGSLQLTITGRNVCSQMSARLA
jgi:hypothetical protein